MRIVVALGGNALLRRGEPMTPEAQHTNVRVAAQALADLARDHQIIVAHGNGPQVGLMALQAAAYAPQSPWPLDILGAETEGMIGYLIEQELVNALPAGANCATLLTRWPTLRHCRPSAECSRQACGNCSGLSAGLRRAR